MTETMPKPGEIQTLAPGLARVLAPNASPMTGPGTNSYILGHGPYVVVDPAVATASHQAALMSATGGEIAAIVLTHRHPDHAGGVAALAQQSGAPVHAWPKPTLGEHDSAVAVDHPLSDGQRLTLGGTTLVAHHTPGHASDHVVLALPETGWLLAGDTLMHDVTVVILPPDGEMSAYFETLDRLLALAPRRVAPGHGRVITAPGEEIRAVIAHRRQREREVAAALSETTPTMAEDLVAGLYPDLDSRLLPVAAAQITAHLIRLACLGRAEETPAGWRARAC